MFLFEHINQISQAWQHVVHQQPHQMTCVSSQQSGTNSEDFSHLELFSVTTMYLEYLYIYIYTLYNHCKSPLSTLNKLYFTSRVLDLLCFFHKHAKLFFFFRAGLVSQSGLFKDSLLKILYNKGIGCVDGCEVSRSKLDPWIHAWFASWIHTDPIWIYIYTFVNLCIY